MNNIRSLLGKQYENAQRRLCAVHVLGNPEKKDDRMMDDKMMGRRIIILSVHYFIILIRELRYPAC